MPERVSFTPSQAGGSTSTVPLAWTASPFSLLVSDMRLFLANTRYVLGILLPWPSHHLDELYPSPMNLWTLAVHTFLVFYQLAFLFSLFLCLIFLMPYPLVLLYCAIVFGFNKLVVTLFLNGPAYLDSTVDLTDDLPHPNECWIFLNGVSVGSHWLQANINRIALTFRRHVRGVHNPTDGIIFDLLQCLIERNFCYSTEDVREAYVHIKGALLETRYTKIVLILHSQGGIQGSLIVDWLLSEIPQSRLEQLEIYTFGNAANHFNNPPRDPSALKASSSRATKSIGHIEHYCNTGDFVAQWGILNFTRVPNRYMGRLFERPGKGHLLNQHYLNAIFPLGTDGRVLEKNAFMEMDVDPADRNDLHKQPAGSPNGKASGSDAKVQRKGMHIRGRDQRLLGDDQRESFVEALIGEPQSDSPDGESMVQDTNSPLDVKMKRQSRTARVKDFSRLWQYRNGRGPPI